jgi:cell fate regulator YaaT (PSP1 superfamily)
MTEIIGVRYKRVGKIFFYNPEGVQYQVGTNVIVDNTRGLEMGEVVISNKMVEDNQIVHPLKQVIRIATPQDFAQAENNRNRAKDLSAVWYQKTAEHGLKMKLVEAEYAFDGLKVLFSFTADGRVDFRDLVKDLASALRARIELKQVGPKDGAKPIGGLGLCGRELCCSTFLYEFPTVPIKVAKEQGMALGKEKTSGACGKLMCCLKYEHEAYDHLSKDTPKVNSIVEASSGETGTVIESNLLTGICKVSRRTAQKTKILLSCSPKKILK